MLLEAIDAVVNGLERARLKEGGMLIGGSKKKGGRTAYDVSLAVSSLMLALLQMWQTRHRPELKLRLVYCDR